MSIRYATTDEIDYWNEQLINNPDGGNVFQMHESAIIKQTAGWQPRYIMSDRQPILALEQHIPLLGAFWYIPKGPSVASAKDLPDVIYRIKEFATHQGVFCIKIEPELLNTRENDLSCKKIGLIPTFAVQPNRYTVILDISPSLDDIILGLNQKSRHAIRRAQRDGVTAKAVDLTDKNMEIMYELMLLTAKGNWNLRTENYLKSYWKTFVASGNGQLFFAYYDGQVVAGSFGIFIGSNGMYKDGASVRKRTAYGASHLLQWEMIKWMKQHGVTRYDLCGTPPQDRLGDQTHPFYGIGKFKTSFNKQVTEYIGAYELPIKPLAFRLWKSFIERLVLRIHVTLNHTEWY